MPSTAATDRGRPSAVTTWLEVVEPDRQDEAEWLAEIVHRADGNLDEAIKWKRLTFTIGENWHHWLCAVAATKRSVSLVFHNGALLADPAGLLRGDARYLRHVPYAEAIEHPDAVIALIRDAQARQTDMLDDT